VLQHVFTAFSVITSSTMLLVIQVTLVLFIYKYNVYLLDSQYNSMYCIRTKLTKRIHSARSSHHRWLHTLAMYRSWTNWPSV